MCSVAPGRSTIDRCRWWCMLTPIPMAADDCEQLRYTRFGSTQPCDRYHLADRWWRRALRSVEIEIHNERHASIARRVVYLCACVPSNKMFAIIIIKTTGWGGRMRPHACAQRPVVRIRIIMVRWRNLICNWAQALSTQRTPRPRGVHGRDDGGYSSGKPPIMYNDCRFMIASNAWNKQI